jgi:hypothetical protein
LTTNRTKGSGEISPSEAPTWDDVIKGLKQHINPPSVTRYLDITAPSHLTLGRRGVITVGLTLTPQPDSQDASSLELQPNQYLEVYLHAQAEDFELVGEPVRRITVTGEGGSEPVVFFIKPANLGTKNLALDFRQAGITLATVALTIEVGEEPQPGEQFTLPALTVQTGGPYAPPPDLELRVHTEGTKLSYTLHSPNGAAGFHHYPAGTVDLMSSPRDFQRHTMRKLEKYSEGKDLDDHPLTPSEIETKLAGLGNDLYDELFTTRLRNEYRALRGKIEKGEIQSLLVTSDEPWIPWELIKPYDDDDMDDIIDHDFLCQQFQVTRWLAGRSGGAGQIQVSRLACIEAGQVPGEDQLPYAQSERQYIAELAEELTGVEDATPTVADGQAVESLLDNGGINLYHFAAHGNASFAHPDESVVILSDGRSLRASDITGKRQTHIARDRPLVFLNACRVGQQSWSLTRLGGWAAVFVDRARCGAFIGPLWSVNDFLAYEFARSFYEALQDGQTFGEANQVARRRIRDLYPQNPTWLAYSVYAHPNGRVQFANNGGHL